jgi:hypothetical protein
VSAFHRCDVPDLDYSTVTEGRIVCRVCGWGWRLTTQGWKRMHLGGGE